MYKYWDRHTMPLFGELFPFGGKLDKENMWRGKGHILILK